jgi:hypothetical protein
MKQNTLNKVTLYELVKNENPSYLKDEKMIKKAYHLLKRLIKESQPEIEIKLISNPKVRADPLFHF